MSNSPSAPENPSPLVSSACEPVSRSSPGHDLTTTPQTIPTAITPFLDPALPPAANSLSSAASESFNQQSPSFSDTQSFFTTHHSVTPDSAATTPRLPPTQQSRDDLHNALQDVAADLQLPTSLSSEATASSLLSLLPRSPSPITSPTPRAASANRRISDSGGLEETATGQGGTGHRGGNDIKVKDFAIVTTFTTSATPRKSQTLFSSKSKNVHRPTLSLRMSTTWSPLDASVPEATIPVEDGNRDVREETQRRSVEKGKKSTGKDHGEEQIEATLANEEPLSNARSRKASHYLGLFKENVVSQEQRRSKDRSTKGAHKARRSTVVRDEPLDVRPILDGKGAAGEAAYDAGGIHQKRPESPSPYSVDFSQKLKKEDEHLGSTIGLPASELLSPTLKDASDQSPPDDDSPSESPHDLKSIEWWSEQPSQGTLPLRLLEDIRNRPSSSSSSKGEALESQESRKDRTEGSVSVTAKQEELGAEHFAEVTGKPDELKIEDDEEDESGSDKERIASATYYPHQGPAPDTLGDTSPDQISSFDEDSDEIKKLTRQTSLDPTEEEEGKPPHEEGTSQLQKPASEGLPLGDVNSRVRTSAEYYTSGKTDSNTSSASESEYDSIDSIGRSDRGDESGVTDEGEITPTATPYTHSHIYQSRSRRGPLGAVQLKPYKHQVGGHTKVFSFSKQAICKQLNNRENEFYEVIERRHPELLKFLPRYLGVLNVTYKKGSRRKKKKRIEGEPSPDAVGTLSPGDRDDKKPANSQSTEQIEHRPSPRVISHNAKAETQDEAIPQVIYANNLHIIPDNLFTSPSHTATLSPDTALKSDSASNGSIERPRSTTYGQGYQESAERSIASPKRPPHKQHPSWGATTVNTKLKEQVLREVFSPPPIHHYRRHHRRTSSKIHSLRERRRTPSFLLSQSDSAVKDAEQSAEGVSKISHTSLIPESAEPQSETLKPPRLTFEGTSAPDEMLTEPDLPRLEKSYTTGSESAGSSNSERRRIHRRRSASGLRRHQCDVNTGQRSNLEYFEDEGYGGDKEDDIFSMELADRPIPAISTTPSENGRSDTSHDGTIHSSNTNHDEAGPGPKQSNHEPATTIILPPSTLDPPSSRLPHPPLNPLQAQLQPDERVRHFLLLEDLTASMTHPCVLDLKMGTRQYGIEATAKKQASQRQKCKLTTSSQLGVRLCGMQGWNAETREYFFEDKYAGREIRAGRQFREALKRFLGNGKSEGSVLRHVPVLLEKISRLERIIERLPGYRFYASSLLLLYDGAAAGDEASPADDMETTSTALASESRAEDGGEKVEEKRLVSNIDIKLVDFANCVTSEKKLPDSKPCPPQHPEDVDRGYLRGLRSLKAYLRGIQRGGPDEVEGDGVGGGGEEREEDGYVSF